MKKTIVAVLLVLVAACASAPPKTAAPMRTDLENRELAAILSANPYQPSARMAGWADIQTPTGWMHAKTAVVVNRPHNLKVTLFDPFGSAWFMALANDRNIFYAAPNGGVRSLLPRKEGHPIKIGGFSVNPDDIIMNISPGIEAQSLEGAKMVFRKNGLHLQQEGVSRDLEFDAEKRLIKSVVVRYGQAPLRVTYAYGPADLTVQLNSDLRFRFSRVERMDEIPEGFFDVPAGE